MDKIPFEVRRVLNELVKFWQTGNEPRDLLTHITDTLKSGSNKFTWFFLEVREDLHTDKRANYTTLSEFKQFLKTEYFRIDKEVEEYKRNARADFDALGKEMAKATTRAELIGLGWNARDDFDVLGKEMAKATTRAELVELGRKRADLAPHTGISYVYTRHCWGCYRGISSEIHAQCPVCTRYICSSCTSCFCNSPYQKDF